MVLHTFGRDLKWNPHIHCLISEGGYSDDGFWRHVSYFNYTYLRNAFRTVLLNMMESRIGPSFKKVKSKCYNDHKQGFYVYAKPTKCHPDNVIKYIGRYLGRPVIATSRIDKYDGDMAILSSFGYDPRKCPVCGHVMDVMDIYYNHQRVSLEEMYEATMSKARGMRSSG